jgi:hypothetical protein
VQPGKELVLLIGLGREIRLDYLFQPVAEKLAKLRDIRGDRSLTCPVSEFEPCRLGLFIGLALDVLAVPLSW